MSYAELVGEIATRAYVSRIKNEVLLRYPNFFFEKGAIIYDYDHEIYVFRGFDEDELFILAKVASEMEEN
jgi:hypothetical protein